MLITRRTFNKFLGLAPFAPLKALAGKGEDTAVDYVTLQEPFDKSRRINHWYTADVVCGCGLWANLYICDDWECGNGHRHRLILRDGMLSLDSGFPGTRFSLCSTDGRPMVATIAEQDDVIDISAVHEIVSGGKT